MSIVITGASGQLGRGVVASILERVDPAELILVTRTPDALADLAARGAAVRAGDFNDPAGLASAFAGGERLLLISTDAVGARIAQHSAAVDAAVAAGVGFIAYTSIVNPVAANPAGVVPEHLGTEEKLRSSGVEWCFLRASIYADLEAGNLAAAAASGQLVTNANGGRIAYVARNDLAASAAAVLAGGGHGGQAYDITGPELLDAEGRAAVFAALAGRPVDVVTVDDQGLAEGFAAATGLPIEVGHLIASFGRAAREGYLDVLSGDVQKLTGRAPKTLREVLAA